MPKIEDCPGFESFGRDVLEARKVLGITRKSLAEMVDIDPRYLANIELSGTIPSVPVVIQLIRICELSAERYFYPNIGQTDSEHLQRVIHKLRLCPEKYLTIVEATIDGAIKSEE